VDIVFGGGKYGLKATEWLMKMNRKFVVIDKDENCLVMKTLSLPTFSMERGGFLKGGIKEVLSLIESINPEYIFPTAPIHLSASLLIEKMQLKPWNQGLEFILQYLPEDVKEFLISLGKGSVVLSYNKNDSCIENCSAPDVCPVTKMRKPLPMYELIKLIKIPDSFVVESKYLKPGLGAIEGSTILKLFKWAEDKKRIVIATACRCHGILTALEK